MTCSGERSPEETLWFGFLGKFIAAGAIGLYCLLGNYPTSCHGGSPTTWKSVIESAREKGFVLPQADNVAAVNDLLLWYMIAQGITIPESFPRPLYPSSSKPGEWHSIRDYARERGLSLPYDSDDEAMDILLGSRGIALNVLRFTHNYQQMQRVNDLLQFGTNGGR
jgi:hypothetical protein